MKAHRLVCAYTSSCDESVLEMGPVAIGCPRASLRTSSCLLKNMSDHYKYGMRSSLPPNSPISKATELERLSDEFEDNDQCTVHRDEDDTNHKRRTAGFMAIVSNCNVIIGWNESVRSESMRRNAYHLLKFLHLAGILSSAVAYDSACTFVAYLNHQYGVSLINHTRPECKTILSCSYPVNRAFFEGENTQVCEQLFAHFTKLKATLRSLAWPYSNMFYCLIFHLRNGFETQIFPDNPYLSLKSNIPSPTTTLLEWTQIMAMSKDQLHQQRQDDYTGEDDDIEETYNEYE
ncbi:hypothetical protein I4U23_005700 [Adineta vaga]|nr:hypothetical protein I4U23_005700 [Adineta vaga]